MFTNNNAFSLGPWTPGLPPVNRGDLECRGPDPDARAQAILHPYSHPLTSRPDWTPEQLMLCPKHWHGADFRLGLGQAQ